MSSHIKVILATFPAMGHFSNCLVSLERYVTKTEPTDNPKRTNLVPNEGPVQKPPFTNPQHKKVLLDFSFIAEELRLIFLNRAKAKLCRNV